MTDYEMQIDGKPQVTESEDSLIRELTPEEMLLVSGGGKGGGGGGGGNTR